VNCVLRVPLTTRAVVTAVLRSMFLHFTVTCISENKRCRKRCVTFWTCFVTRNHTVESLCANFFSSCVCVCVCACVRTYIQNVPLQVCRDSGLYEPYLCHAVFVALVYSGVPSIVLFMCRSGHGICIPSISWPQLMDFCVYELWEIRPEDFGMKHADVCCILRQESCIELRISLVRSHLDTVKSIFEV